MENIYFEDRATKYAFRLHITKEFKYNNCITHLSIEPHYGSYFLFGLSEENTTRGLGYQVLETWELQELKDYIRKKYNKNPVFPKTFKEKIKIVKAYMKTDECKGLGWKFPEIREKLGWSKI